MLIFITGGARSGKSRYAQKLAQTSARRVVFAATALPTDDDLRRRILRHRRERPRHWQTLENPRELIDVLTQADKRTELILIDCLTLHVSGRLVKGDREAAVRRSVEKFCKAAASAPIPIILVSNEVGSGVVPMTDLGVRFQDYLGRANQTAARQAKQVILMVSGIPVFIKGDPNER